MRTVYTSSNDFHVCVLPEADRKWQVGQIYACTCGNLFRVVAYYEGKGFNHIGKLEFSKEVEE